MKVPSASSRRAFTLIELLVVISIIAILMTLLFPAVGSALNAAKKAQAKNDSVQIANAITAYASEYGRMPTNNGGDVTASQQTAEIMTTLCPSGSATTDLNPRGITFLEIPKATQDGRNGRVNNEGPYMDPWGQAYFISMDGNYDGSVKGPSGSKESEDIQKTVIVWSKGDKKRKTDYEKPEKWIKSWE